MIAKPFAPVKKVFKLSKVARASKLPGMILGTNGFSLVWDEVNNCICDYMGIPITLADAQFLLERASQHLQYSPAEMLQLRQAVKATRYPTTTVRTFTPAEEASMQHGGSNG